MSEQPKEEFVEVVIKDFNIPSLNGQIYNLDARSTQVAIQEFVRKQEAFGELNHPYDNVPGRTDPVLDEEQYNNMFNRITKIDLSNVVVHMKDLRYDEDKKQIIGKVKPVKGIYETLFQDLEQDKVRFGMRSLCHTYKESPDGPVKLDIDSIITFDIINADIPEK